MASSAFLLLCAIATASFITATASIKSSNDDNGKNTTVSALLAFKQDISHDPTNCLASWSNLSSQHYCEWRGVSCAKGTDNVIALILDSNQLNGSITPQLRDLAHLSYLSVSNNSFHGGIPRELGELSSLTHLDLSDNRLTGSIPSLANCSLIHLDLSDNQLTGSIPSSLANCTHLQLLDLSDNTFTVQELPADIRGLTNLQYLLIHDSSLTGSLTLSIMNFTNLVWLDLSGNRLIGPLPSDWGKLASSIQHIKLQSNLLTGSIPSTLGNCTFLTKINLSNNSLTGELPGSLGKLAMLQHLFVYFTGINGTIPTSLMNCTKLIDLELGYNNLSGSIPAHIGQLSQADWLGFSGNAKLRGRIPDTIGNCAQLTHLIFGFTEVGGPLPSSFYNLTKLQDLRLSSSGFSGILSENVRNLTALATLALDGNAFHGKIPAGLGELTELEGLFLRRNNFEGPIPQVWRCLSISTLDFSYNLLTGSIPIQLGELQGLNNLYLQGNSLSGDVPHVLGSLTRLQNLDLSHNNMLAGDIPPHLSVSESLDLSFNNLTGTIPSSMGSMLMVITMRLAGNHFRGKIPESLEGCTALQVLDLSRNHLEGEIPSTLGELKDLRYINLSHNNLSGALPASLGSLEYLVSLNVSYNALQGMIPSVGIYKNTSAFFFQGNPDLCGYPLPMMCMFQSNHSKKRTTIVVTACMVGGALMVFLLCAACSWWRWSWSARKKMLRLAEYASVNEEWFHKRNPQIRAWTARELRVATNGFDTANIIGMGGVSVCFKGEMEGSKELVAIKRLSTGYNQDGIDAEAWRSFMHELNTLCQMRHRNLVKALGYCKDEGEMGLVMEFMHNGNLDEYLHGDSRSILSWEGRLHIAADVAEGLVYLHYEYIHPIIHCDLKPANILLGAKISDFGIAKLLDCNHTGDYSSTSYFRGTLGYAAPECAAGTSISTKVDVYSYGVLLMELMTGRKPTSPEVTASGMSMHTWAKAFLRSKQQDTRWTEGMLDTSVQGAIENDPAILQQVEELLDLGVKCTNGIAKDRPSTRAIRETLNKFTNPNKAPSSFFT